MPTDRDTSPHHNNRVPITPRTGLLARARDWFVYQAFAPYTRTRRIIVVVLFLTVVLVGGAHGAQAACDPALDETCVVPGQVVAALDERQFSLLVSLAGISVALSLATFVWHASSPLRLRRGRRES